MNLKYAVAIILICCSVFAQEPVQLNSDGIYVNGMSETEKLEFLTDIHRSAKMIGGILERLFLQKGRGKVTGKALPGMEMISPQNCVDGRIQPDLIMPHRPHRPHRLLALMGAIYSPSANGIMSQEGVGYEPESTYQRKIIDDLLSHGFSHDDAEAFSLSMETPEAEYRIQYGEPILKHYLEMKNREGPVCDEEVGQYIMDLS